MYLFTQTKMPDSCTKEVMYYTGEKMFFYSAYFFINLIIGKVFLWLFINTNICMSLIITLWPIKHAADHSVELH